MNTEQQKVKDWMRKFGQETPKNPCIPSLEIRKLRAKLILEEALETIHALGLRACDGSRQVEFHPQSILIDERDDCKPNLVEVVDGLADLNYVSYGTAVACGLDMEPIEAEVHRSNMSKLWDYKEFTAMPPGFKETHYSKLYPENMKVIVKNQDGKVIKSPSYSLANLKPIIDSQSI